MLLLWFLLGACLGSFCCVVAVRLPQNRSLIFPRSHCQACQTPLSWYELVPLLAFLWQKARCRHCHAKIPASCFWAELSGGLLLASCVTAFHSLHGLLWLFLSFTLALADCFYLILEPKLFYPGATLLVLYYLSQGGPLYWTSFLYCLFLVGLCRLLLRGKLGSGDLLLLLAWSLWLPLQQFALLLLIACSAGLVAFAFCSLLRRRLRELPFIPFLTFGLWLVLLH